MHIDGIGSSLGVDITNVPSVCAFPFNFLLWDYKL